jgi:hypothetical protein
MTNEVCLIRDNLTGVRIRDQDETALKSSIAVIVEKIFVLAGQTPEKRDIVVICIEIASDLKKRYKNMTLSEVDYALNCGVRGDYGEYYGINVVSINKWLKTYYNSDERREAQRSIISSRMALPQKTELTEDEKRKITIKACAEAWALAKSGKYVKDRGNPVYNFLDEKGEIQFTSEEKQVFMQRAKTELEAEARKYACNAIQPLSYFLDRITEHGIIARAKRIALNEFFTRMIQENKDLYFADYELFRNK